MGHKSSQGGWTPEDNSCLSDRELFKKGYAKNDNNRWHWKHNAGFNTYKLSSVWPRG